MQAAWTLLGLYDGAGNQTGIPSLLQSKLFSFSFPISLAKQQEIARLLQAVDHKVAAEEAC